MRGDSLYLVAADAILVTHVLFVAFVITGLVLVVVGHFRHWSWVRDPWFRLAHLGAIGVVVLQAWLGRVCPLTIWEMALRRKAGEAGYEGSFVAHWLQRILYFDLPWWVFVVCYTAFGLMVLTTWMWIRPRPFRRRSDSGHR